MALKTTREEKDDFLHKVRLFVGRRLEACELQRVTAWLKYNPVTNDSAKMFVDNYCGRQ